MLAVTTSPETLSLEIPSAIALYITLEQFEALAAVNRDLKLERTVQGELIV
ncbi:MAG: Uma2 family endonuclease, partial [Microcystis aeruginosa]